MGKAARRRQAVEPPAQIDQPVTAALRGAIRRPADRQLLQPHLHLQKVPVVHLQKFHLQRRLPRLLPDETRPFRARPRSRPGRAARPAPRARCCARWRAAPASVRSEGSLSPTRKFSARMYRQIALETRSCRRSLETGSMRCSDRFTEKSLLYGTRRQPLDDEALHHREHDRGGQKRPAHRRFRTPPLHIVLPDQATSGPLGWSTCWRC